MAHFTGINHLAMVTADMDATIRFWRDLLGLPMVAGLGGARYRHYFFSISPQDMIAFFEWPEAEAIEEKDHGMPVAGPVAFDHISFGVAGDDDLFDLKARLEAAGFWTSELVDHGFIHSLYSFDPNNIPIEFSAPVREVDIRATPRMIDANPSECAKEGPWPRPEFWPELWPEGQSVPAEERVVYPGEGEEFLDEDKNIWKDLPEKK